MPINTDTAFVISPTIIQDLLDSMGPTGSLVQENMSVLIQEIIDNARIFIERFKGCYFLSAEPIHEFTGLEFRDPDTSHLLDSVKFRMIVRPTSVGIFTVDELPLDDMYDIRFVIAESQQPEYQ